MTEYSTSEFQRLMASVGSLMFYWSRLEDELVEDVRRLRIEIEGSASRVRGRKSFSDRMGEWRALQSQKTRRKPDRAKAVEALANEMEQLKQTRNLVAHDFSGASARPEDEEPFISCGSGDRGSPNAAPTRITQSELTKIIEAIDQCRARIRRVAAESGTSA